MFVVDCVLFVLGLRLDLAYKRTANVRCVFHSSVGLLKIYYIEENEHKTEEKNDAKR